VKSGAELELVTAGYVNVAVPVLSVRKTSVPHNHEEERVIACIGSSLHGRHPLQRPAESRPQRIVRKTNRGLPSSDITNQSYDIIRLPIPNKVQLLPTIVAHKSLIDIDKLTGERRTMSKN
jgi:hypothetical protein